MTSSWIDLELTGLGLVFRMVFHGCFLQHLWHDGICGDCSTFDTLAVEAVAVIDTLVDLKRLSSIQ